MITIILRDPRLLPCYRRLFAAKAHWAVCFIAHDP